MFTDAEMRHEVDEKYRFSMVVDTGKDLHVVILKYDEGNPAKQHLVHLSVCRDFADLDPLVKRFRVDRCVIDGLPETHATRAFAHRHRAHVYLCFFNEHQRGSADWNHGDQNVFVNRTEALDASRAAIRNKLVVLPRRTPPGGSVRAPPDGRRQNPR